VYCAECGTQLADGAKYCTSCGTAVGESANGDVPGEQTIEIHIPVAAGGSGRMTNEEQMVQIAERAVSEGRPLDGFEKTELGFRFVAAIVKIVFLLAVLAFIIWFVVTVFTSG
jgi:hypothetical protein